jgi:hypothetical protein
MISSSRFALSDARNPTAGGLSLRFSVVAQKQRMVVKFGYWLLFEFC